LAAIYLKRSIEKSPAARKGGGAFSRFRIVVSGDMTDNGINLKTFGDLLRHGFKLSGFCRRCSVHRVIDLAKCPPDRPYVGARFKCRDCAGAVEITLSQIVTGSEAHLPALERWRRG
tara:strand:- start:106 stop:456 length:351 start_codon:yes stop_codon:yes gene_type:complete